MASFESMKTRLRQQGLWNELEDRPASIKDCYDSFVFMTDEILKRLNKCEQEKSELRAQLAEIHSAEPVGYNIHYLVDDKLETALDKTNEIDYLCWQDESGDEWPAIKAVPVYLHPPIPSQQLEWSQVTEEFLNNKPEWFHGPLWVYDGTTILLGRYMWVQGYYPDRLRGESLDMPAMGKFVQPCVRPAEPQPNNNRSQDGE